MVRFVAAAGWALVMWASAAQAGLLSVPEGYTPENAWPVIVSYQDNPSAEQMKAVPYFLLHAGGQGMEATTKTREYLLDLARRYNIDPLRIYGTGFSRGGQEALQQAWEHPDWFAAIAPVCNDLRRKEDRNLKDLNVMYLANVPTLLLHGSGDSFRRSGEVLFEHMKTAGCPVQLQLYPGGHSPQLPFKENVKMLTEFFDKHRLEPLPKRVVHVLTHPRHSRAFWVDAAVVKADPKLKAAYEVTVKPGNRIELAVSDQVAAVALYLNDKLVDMQEPVTVVRVPLPAALVPQIEEGTTGEPVKALATRPAGEGEKVLYKGPALANLKITLREGMPLPDKPAKLLWEEIAETRPKAAPATTQPAARPKGDQ